MFYVIWKIWKRRNDVEIRWLVTSAMRNMAPFSSNQTIETIINKDVPMWPIKWQRVSHCYRGLTIFKKNISRFVNKKKRKIKSNASSILLYLDWAQVILNSIFVLTHLMTVASFIIVCNLQQKVIEDNRERANNRRAGRRWTSHTAGIFFYAFFHDTKVNKKVFFFCLFSSPFILDGSSC